MAVTQTGSYSNNWTIVDDKANPDSLLSFVENVQQIIECGSAIGSTIALSGSILGYQIQGDFAAVKKEYQDIDLKKFTNGSFQASFPEKGNFTLILNINFAQRLLSLNLQGIQLPFIKELYEKIIAYFPYDLGISTGTIHEKSNEIDKLSHELTAFIQKSKVVDKIKVEVETKNQTLQKLLESSNSSKEEILKSYQEITEWHKQIKAIVPEIENVKVKIEADKKVTSENSAQTTAMQAQVKAFFDEVVKYKKEYVENNAKLISSIETAKKQSAEIIQTNIGLQQKIKEHLLKAVGASLFSAFAKRKGSIVISKWVWAGLSVFSLLVQSGLVIWLAYEAKGVGNSASPFYSQPLFLLKITVTLPVFALIVFCVSQYSKERANEETYAFKAALSFSLSPYLDLIKDVGKENESPEYREFVVKTIGQIFENPKEAPKHSEDILDKEKISKLTDMFEKLNKTIDKIKGS
jgi:2-hydroxy-3-keto-5-methylthiopentenyl-1-phosphate phosphatase